jgi:hypothetical protein
MQAHGTGSTRAPLFFLRCRCRLLARRIWRGRLRDTIETGRSWNITAIHRVDQIALCRFAYGKAHNRISDPFQWRPRRKIRSLRKCGPREQRERKSELSHSNLLGPGSQRSDIDGPALAITEADRSFTPGPFMMLLHDCRERRCFCNERHSIYHRSRGAVFRFLADSSLRWAHSTAHRRIAGRASCRLPGRISCGSSRCVGPRVGSGWRASLARRRGCGSVPVRPILPVTPVFGRRTSDEFTKYLVNELVSRRPSWMTICVSESDGLRIQSKQADCQHH